MANSTAVHHSTVTLRAAWDALRAREPHLHNPAAARRLGVSEAELVASRAGDGAWPLVPEVAPLLGEIAGMGRLLFACSGTAGVALALVEGIEVSATGERLDLKGEDFDLALVPAVCASAWYFEDFDHHGHTRSVQLFDAEGGALLKVLVLRKRHRPGLRALAEAWAGPAIVPASPPAPAAALAEARAPTGSGLSEAGRAVLEATTRVEVTVNRPGCQLRRAGPPGELSEDAHGFHLASSGLKLHARPGILACDEIGERERFRLRWGAPPAPALEIACGLPADGTARDHGGTAT